MVRLGEFRTWVVGMAAVLAACSVAAGLAPMTAQTDELRKVLISIPTTPATKGSDDLVDGIRASLAESGKRVVVKVEYLDSKEFPRRNTANGCWTRCGKYRKHPLRSSGDDRRLCLRPHRGPARCPLRLGAGGVLRHKLFRSRPACRTPGFRGYRRESQFCRYLEAHPAPPSGYPEHRRHS